MGGKCGRIAPQEKMKVKESMLKGCYPARIGFGSFDGDLVLFPGMGMGLDPGERTMAARLRDLGYATMLVGKIAQLKGMSFDTHAFPVFGIPAFLHIQMTPVEAATLTISLNTAAFAFVVFRSGIESIDRAP